MHRRVWSLIIAKFSGAIMYLIVYPALWRDFNLAINLTEGTHPPCPYFHSLLKAGRCIKDGCIQCFSFFP